MISKRIQPYISNRQKIELVSLMSGDTKFSIEQLMTALEDRIEKMPMMYKEDMDEPLFAYLHYFQDEKHWYILEKDAHGVMADCFGYRVDPEMNIYEFCYVSITELVRNGVKIDLDFTPCRVSELIEKYSLDN